MRLARRTDCLKAMRIFLHGCWSVALLLQHVSARSYGSTMFFFENSAPVTINDYAGANLGRALPYPSAMNVSGVSGRVTKVTAALRNVTHTYSRDINVFLVGPKGQKVVLMSETGGTTSATALISNATLSFDDAAPAFLPATESVTSGIYKPTQLRGLSTPSFPDEPAGNRSDNLAVLNDQDANGIWRLFVVDNSPGGSGSIAGGWSLSITTGNSAPTISAIPDKTIPVDGVATASLTVSDAETTPQFLTLTGSSSNQTLVPDGNIIFAVGGANRSVAVVPASKQKGTARITVTVSDGSLTASTSFDLRVGENQPPTISPIPNQVIPEDAVAAVSVIIGDSDTPVETLTLSANSSNQLLVRDLNIIFAGAGGNRQCAVIPNADQTGTALITISVSDRSSTNSVSFQLTVQPVNDFPTIGAIANQTVPMNGSTGPIAFVVNDQETPPEFLVVTGESSNTTLVQNGNILFGGSGINRTVTVTPAVNQQGLTTITLSVGDSEGFVATRSFVVSIQISQNEPPTISFISNQSTDVDKATPVIAFTVGDRETAAADLVVSKASSNSTLVPNENIFIGGGSGAIRTVFVLPSTGQQGQATITITVTDAGPGPPKSASHSFLVTVATNQAPTISNLSNQTTQRDKPTTVASFTVSDAETLPGLLAVAGSSSNTSLIRDAGITFGGSGASRTVTVTPVPNGIGTATITLTVTDAGGKTAITSFTLTVRPPPAVNGDFDGDGQSDVLFQDSDGFLASWLMNGSNLAAAGFLLPSNVGDSAYSAAVTGDFNDDGFEDIVFQHTDGTLAVWFLNGTAQVNASLLNPSNPGDNNWRAVTSGDINKDGKPDVIFQHTDGSLGVWFMSGVDRVSSVAMNPSSAGSGWRAVATGDFNSDGALDLIFQHADGNIAVWLLDGTRLVRTILLNPANPGTGWRLVGTGRFSRPMNVTLSGAAERPNPITTSATGSGELALAGNRLSFKIIYSGLSGVGTAAHIHLPAATEQTAGVEFDLQPFSGGAFGVSGTLAGTVSLSASQVSAMAQGLSYVNIHTAANPAGEIRGQIVDDAAKAGPTDLLFQHSNYDLAVWLMDGTNLLSSQQLNPRNSGGTWRVAGPLSYPIITTPPQSQTAAVGASISFVVVADGAQPLKYQWRKDGANIPNATSARYSIANVQTSHAGAYSVVVSNAAGSVTSSNATLTVGAGEPDLTKSTDNISRVSGSPGDTFTMTLRVINRGNAASVGTKVSFYLHKDSEDFNDASKIDEIELGNLAAGVTSSEIGLGYAFPKNGPTGNYTFSYWIDAQNVVAESNENNNKWWFTSIPITNSRFVKTGTATLNGLLRDAITLSAGQNLSGSFPYVAANGGNPNAIITVVVGFVNSNSQWVGPEPQVVYQGIPSQLGDNGTVTWTGLTAPAVADTYQVRYRAYFTVFEDTARANFKSNQEIGASFAGAAALVTVTTVTPPAIFSQPQTQTVLVGKDAAFNVTASGTAPLSYQWRKDGADIADATNAILTLNNVQKSNAGIYSVVVSNSGGSIASVGARLEIKDGQPKPTFNLTISSNRIPESVGTVKVTVTKSGTGSGTVRLRLQESTAKAVKGRIGDFFDLAEADATLHFENNESVKEVLIAIADDLLEEPVEDFSVTLEAADWDTIILGSPSQTISLLDNDTGAFSRNGTNYIRPDWSVPGRGSLSVQISGPGGEVASPEARWRFPWDANWRTNTELVLDLPAGVYPIEWRPVVGQRPPLVISVQVKADVATDQAASYRVGATNMGIASVSLDPIDGTAWRIAGNNNSPWLKNNDTWPASPGRHLIEFQERNDYVKPAPIAISVPLLGASGAHGQYSLITRIDAGAVPTYISRFSEITNGVKRGYPFNGQVWTSFGWGSAFAVSDRVIVTAAHLVSGFQSGTNRKASFLYWFPQRNGAYLPVRPLKARDWFVPEPYAGSNGASEWDFAAVYFDEPVCPQGWGGYLVSDINETLHLESSRTGVQLVGYPMDGKRFGLESQVRDHYMHQKRVELPGRAVFTPLRNYRVEQTAVFQSVFGNSGGPVYVPDPLNLSVDLPAGIYLGTNANGAIVRAIDRDVVEQILKAATAANIYINQCFGGCPPEDGTGSGAEVVGLTVLVEPPGIFGATDGVVVETSGARQIVFLQVFDTDFLVGLDYNIRVPDIHGFKTPSAKPFKPKPSDVGHTIRFKYERLEGLVLRLVSLDFTRRMRLEISGETNKLVFVEVASSVLGPWTNLTDVSPVQTGANGQAEVEVTRDSSLRFYRARAP